MLERISLKIGEFLGLLAFYLWRSRRRIALNALRETLRVMPLNPSLSPEEITKEMFRNLGRSLVEILRLYAGDRSLLKKVEFRGLEHFWRAKEESKGIIFLTGHCGNWELMAISFGALIEPIGVVARPLNNRFLNRIIEKIRTRYGNHVIYKKGAVKEILRDLRMNRAVGILMDQSVSKKEGVVINFLGRPAWTSRMPGLIARKTGAVVLPAFIKRSGMGHIVEIGERIELKGLEPEDIKRLSEPIERFILSNPSEWLWIHRRWKKRD